MAQSPFISARQAADELGVRLPTLYAYVSRGLIRSEATTNARRERRYHHEDVQRLKERKEQRRHPAQVAAKALRWGAPVLDSELTMIADGKLYYRGYDATVLAGDHSLEEVAALLWTGDLSADRAALFSRAHHLPVARYRAALKQTPDLGLVARLQVALALAEQDDPAAFDLHPLAIAQTGARILRLLALIATGAEETPAPIAHVVQGNWAPKHPRASHLINTALVLCTDHELNVSSFTARCVASAGATPYAAIMAGLDALSGPRHGGNTKQVEALFQEIGAAANARRVLASRLRRGENIPGFGHVLYPDGDPRARMLLDQVLEAFPRSRQVLLGQAITAQALDLIGEHPTIDLALVLLARVLDFPKEGALGIFALGRTVGWIAHIIEQYQTQTLIRPRARYIGVLPKTQGTHSIRA